MQERQVRSLGQEDPLEKEAATHSSILARKISWTRGAWQATDSPRGHRRVVHDLEAKQLCKVLFTHKNHGVSSLISFRIKNKKYVSSLISAKMLLREVFLAALWQVVYPTPITPYPLSFFVLGTYIIDTFLSLYTYVLVHCLCLSVKCELIRIGNLFCSPPAHKTAPDTQCLLSLVAQSCPTLCDPMNCSQPGFSVHGDSPGKNTGVGCCFLLQGIFPTQESSRGHLHCRQILYQLSYQGSPIFN